MTTDQELHVLCRNHLSPTLYVDLVVSSYDIGGTSRNTNWMDDLDDIRKVRTSSEWFNEPTRFPVLNRGPNEDGEDEDYVASEGSSECSSSDSEEEDPLL